MNIITLALVTILAAGTSAPQHAHPQDRAHEGMGFDQQATTHHFLLERSGGTIEVTAKNADDTTSIAQIQTHLRHIASAFAQGDFSLPVFIHDTTPPGVDTMKARRATMTFDVVELPAGGRVIVKTKDADALAALHEFLRFQIREHKTGDPREPK
jgi:hypothetical protein